MTYTIELTGSELDLLAKGLNKLPREESNDLFNKLLSQYQEQSLPKPIKVAKNAPKQ